MGHTGQLDGLAQNDPEEKDLESSSRREVKMTKVLIHMMKQQWKDIKSTPSSNKEAMSQIEDQGIRREE
eukprot:5757963-Prorocentrum_lima.AAC.1